MSLVIDLRGSRLTGVILCQAEERDENLGWDRGALDQTLSLSPTWECDGPARLVVVPAVQARAPMTNCCKSVTSIGLVDVDT